VAAATAQRRRPQGKCARPTAIHTVCIYIYMISQVLIIRTSIPSIQDPPDSPTYYVYSVIYYFFLILSMCILTTQSCTLRVCFVLSCFSYLSPVCFTPTECCINHTYHFLNCVAMFNANIDSKRSVFFNLLMFVIYELNSESFHIVSHPSAFGVSVSLSAIHKPISRCVCLCVCVFVWACVNHVAHTHTHTHTWLTLKHQLSWKVDSLSPQDEVTKQETGSRS